MYTHACMHAHTHMHARMRAHTHTQRTYAALTDSHLVTSKNKKWKTDMTASVQGNKSKDTRG